jgi:nucleotide-binding universal stress UspA family protein
MKSLLIPIGGSDTDEALFATAFAAARPFGSHMNFFHVHIGPGQAAANEPHTAFAMGPALSNALKDLHKKAKVRSTLAAQHFHEFCERSRVEICDIPCLTKEVTASWHEEDSHALQRILFRARHNDLVIAGRAKSANGLPTDFLEQLIIGSGRPVLIAGPSSTAALTDTIMVCWKETAEAARAVNAAMPLLIHARRVVIVGVVENDENIADGLSDVARQLGWSGVRSEIRTIVANGAAVPGLLSSAAKDCGADLVVLGAYGRSRVRELLFGSCTQSMIRNAETSVLLMH